MEYYKRYGGKILTLFFLIYPNINEDLANRIYNITSTHKKKILPDKLFKLMEEDAQNFIFNAKNLPDILKYKLPVLTLDGENNTVLYLKIEFLSYNKNSKLTVYTKGKKPSSFELTKFGMLSGNKDNLIFFYRLLENGELKIVEGISTGYCQECGTELTDHQSILLGIGPVCLNKLADEEIDLLNLNKKNKDIKVSVKKKKVFSI